MGDARLLDYIIWDGCTNLTDIDVKVVCNPNLKIKRTFSKGVKLKSEYLGNNNELVFVKIWDENSSTKTITKRFQVIDREGDLCREKNISIEMEPTAWEERKEKQRKDALRYLKSKAKVDGRGQYIDLIYSFFKEEIADFYETGSGILRFEINKIANIDITSLPTEEQTLVTTIKSILNGNYGTSGLTIAEMIIYQTT